MFFSLMEDIDCLVLEFEAMNKVRYCLVGMHDSEAVPTYSSLRDLPNVGYVTVGDWNRIDTYLISRVSSPVVIRTVPQRSRGVKYALDQRENPQTVEIKLGGIYSAAGNVIVAGRLATVSQDSESLNMYTLLSRLLKTHFRRIESFYVGKHAEEKLYEGWRLVTNSRLPREYDLERSSKS